MKKRYIVFDLDGTLVESLPGIAEGVNRALRSLGLPTRTQAEVRHMIGRGAANLCAQAIGHADASVAPAEILEAVHAAFRREYPHCWQGDNTRVFPWMRMLLVALAAAGAKLAVLSNKPDDVTRPMVRELFPLVPFSTVMGFTGELPRKPAPDALQHIAAQWGVETKDLTLVGDSLIDAATAANAGCRLALVAWGYSQVGDLAATGAPLFGTVEELEKFLLQEEG